MQVGGRRDGQILDDARFLEEGRDAGKHTCARHNDNSNSKTSLANDASVAPSWTNNIALS